MGIIPETKMTLQIEFCTTKPLKLFNGIPVEGSNNVSLIAKYITNKAQWQYAAECTKHDSA